ncbi:MAG: hypothetical protein K0R26_1058 [Bacteroidota bacterium]|jgi:hypothetical protein|nr:hypothetical protein [Bacteroidota bacterium]
MKIASYFLLMIITFAGLAQNTLYKEQLRKNIQLFENAKSYQEFEYAARGFETLALKEKKDWLPFYYAALCQVVAAFKMPKSEVDHSCDLAESFTRRSDSLSKENSEVAVLKSMIAAARINVNKAQRGKKYGAAATKFALEAIKLNEHNPRAYFVKAQAILHTPPAFGGGDKKAKPVFEIVLQKHKDFKPESVLHPKWGKAEAEKELKKMSGGK